MLDFNYVYKKEVDWSLLNQGLSIPLNIQVIFRNNIKKFISRGESRDVYLVLDGISYKVKLVNQKFDESKYPNHNDILQIRYNPQSVIADKLRSVLLIHITTFVNKEVFLKKGKRNTSRFLKVKKNSWRYILLNMRIHILLNA